MDRMNGMTASIEQNANGMDEANSFIAERIKWRAGKHGLPRGQTRFADEVPADEFTTVASIAEEVDAGEVVIICFKDDANWTSVGTRKIFGVSNGVQIEVAYNEISDLMSRDYPPSNWKEHEFEELGPLKLSWEYLAVANNSNQRLDFWVPPAQEAFAIWNVVLMLWRMSD